MKLVESADGTITIIELDPTKAHIIVADAGAMTRDQLQRVRIRDGLILIKQPGTTISIVEAESLDDVRVGDMA